MSWSQIPLWNSMILTCYYLKSNTDLESTMVWYEILPSPNQLSTAHLFLAIACTGLRDTDDILMRVVRRRALMILKLCDRSLERFTIYITLPETNMAPENDTLEKEIPIGNHHFRCYVSFRECILPGIAKRVKLLCFLQNNSQLHGRLFLKIALQDQLFSLMGVVIPLDLANKKHI